MSAACPETGHVRRNLTQFARTAASSDDLIRYAVAYLAAAGCSDCGPCTGEALRITADHATQAVTA